MDITKHTPAVLSTATGRRGLDIGFERAFTRLGWLWPRTVAYVEIESFAAWNLVKQMEQGVLAAAPVFTNLKTFDFSLVRNKVDFILGGYPCQPFSLAGKQLAEADPRHLWPYYEAGIPAARPVGCFFENVRNHLNKGYNGVKEGLERLGYTVREGIFSAEEVGAPHQRDRLFILAVDNAYCGEPGTVRRNFEKMFGLPQQERANECAPVSGRAGNELAEPQTVAHAGSQQLGQQDNKACALPRGDAGADAGRGSEILDNTFREGLERQPGHGSAAGWQGSLRPAASTSFPLGQGPWQYTWEEPRVESRLGLTVNGYDFTDDLLRLAGNSVVEQVAELAFLTLLEEF